MRLLLSIEAGGAVFCARIWAVTANHILADDVDKQTDDASIALN